MCYGLCIDVPPKTSHGHKWGFSEVVGSSVCDAEIEAVMLRLIHGGKLRVMLFHPECVCYLT